MATKPDIGLLVGDTVRPSVSVEACPRRRLEHWQVAETTAGTRHFVGWARAAQEGRVSSAVVRFDRESRTGVTESGRIYELDGPSGHDEDAGYVCGVLVALERVTAKREVNHSA